MDFRVIADNFPFLAAGFKMTLILTFWSVAGGFVVGMPLGIARASRLAAVRYPAMLLIEIVRGTPVLMIVFWVYFMLPLLIGPVEAFTAGLIALITFSAAYSAEIFRAGIQAVDRGQIEAGRASGLNWLQVMRLIVLPQALANMTPALMSQAVMIYKSTSLVYVIGVIELFRAATILNNREFKSFEIYAFVAVVYLVPSTFFSRLSRAIERRRMLKHGVAAHA